ncbi:chemotaxis protein CheA [Ovoidimarina sediminis]|uniref:chemotaxis protein CheA n=1 Tax=Ovoidimarina sediminis TaxID=3079856 RepID=UPI00290E768D|nr:chemotaxis protein CheA [Rhodophyticola sp. MJ-SS7]MDU8945135.1 chemotaxis protein CheA [Rhodophyticola sp. MJ-SS7]
MSDPMQEIRDSFFIECEELLEALMDALQSMEAGEHDSETINVAFRAVHSIKGGAGAFGLDQLVSFAHAFETVMDQVRSGALEIDGTLVNLFFQCGDALSDLVRVAREDDTLPAEDLAGLLAELGALSGEDPDAGGGEEEEVTFEPMGISLDLPGLELDDDPADGGELDALPIVGGDLPLSDAAEGPRRVRIHFTPEAGLYQSGNEPLFLLRALADLGTAEIRCLIGNFPDIDSYGDAASSLAWEITLETEASEAEIREVFDFAQGLCALDIADAPPMDDPGAAGGDGAPEATSADPDQGSAEASAVRAADASTGPETIDVPPPADGDAATGPTPKDSAPDADAEPAPPAPLKDAAAPAGIEPAMAEPPAPPEAASAGKPQGAGAPAAKSNATVRVDLDRIDRLVNLVGELVINQAMLSQSIAASGMSGNTKIASGLDEFQQLTRDVQDSVMMIRAQPVKSLFQRMSRIVREASAAVGKTVRLRTDGEGTEIDKTVIERLSDPLTHMIRNAVDHGLESTEARVAAGKPPEGTVTLTASHRSGRVVIEIADDGGGINRARVKSIAEEKGLIPPGQDLSDGKVDNLLFLPGFSTAKEVSNLSGRGVGMDVVKNAISALGGRISINSEAGIGTTFSISLPLTLAVLDGMVVRVAGETLVMPLSAISETLSLQNGDARQLGPSTQVIKVREQFVPLIDLGTELGYAPPRTEYAGAIVLLISQEDGKRAALVVDGIEDQRQVVIKGLADSYGHVPGVAAATILGDGQIALILDPTDLLTHASGLSRPGPALAAVG